jgi:SAM-dependent methyltransferase
VIKNRGETTANVFDEMGVYWAEIADKNQTEEQIQFLKSHLKPKGYVLDLACGTGRHSIPLSQQGFCMVGLDVSLKLLRIAKLRSSQLQVVRGDMQHLPFKAGAFADVVSVDTSFGYLPSEVDDRASLSEVRRVLFQRSIFVIDVFNRENLVLRFKEQNKSIKEKDYPSFFLQQKRTISGDGGWLCDSWTVRDKKDGTVRFFEHKVRLFGKDVLAGLLEEAGFAVEEVYGSYNGGKFSADSPRLIIVARVK